MFSCHAHYKCCYCCVVSHIYTVTILHTYMFVSCCYPVHLTTEPVHQNEFRILHAKPVMCLLVSLVVCEHNIEHPTMQW